jgi:hypothetical protein
MNQQRMTNACRLLADHIQSMPLDEELYNELRFLRQEIAETLTEPYNQQALLEDFEIDQSLEPVQNPWLRELTDRYFS